MLSRNGGIRALIVLSAGLVVLMLMLQARRPIAMTPGTPGSEVSPSPDLISAADDDSPLRRSSRGFQVRGNHILDPAGHRFIVKGNDAVYGRFAGGNAHGWGLMNYQNAQRDLDTMKASGYNLVQITVSWDLAHLPPTDPDFIPFSQYLSELDSVVGWVTQRGMVAELSHGQTAATGDVNAFVAILAGRYRNNPYVWLKPDNEPNCQDGDRSLCYDWPTWQKQESTYVRTIRRAGYAGPIVVNCIAWSWDCSQILKYPLGDRGVVYGAHWYGSGAATFDARQRAETDKDWANLARQVPVIVDEVGTESNPGQTSPLTWSQGFLDYVTDWVRDRDGSGCIAFVDSWSDDNGMLDPTTGRWNAWGQTFIDWYLKRVP